MRRLINFTRRIFVYTNRIEINKSLKLNYYICAVFIYKKK
jgi:hypothetical protein